MLRLTESITELCTRKSWFTAGSTIQYGKMFDMAHSDASNRELALCIWMCSDSTSLEEVYNELEKVRFEVDVERKNEPMPYPQIKWERDTAVSQLKALGTSFGEEPKIAEKRIKEKAINEFIQKLDKKSEYARPVGWSTEREIICMDTVRQIAEEM